MPGGSQEQYGVSLGPGRAPWRVVRALNVARADAGEAYTIAKVDLTSIELRPSVWRQKT